MKNLLSTTLIALSVLFAQEDAADAQPKHRFIFEPDSLSLNVGETATVTIKLVDSNGDLAQNPFYVFGLSLIHISEPTRPY